MPQITDDPKLRPAGTLRAGFSRSGAHEMSRGRKPGFAMSADHRVKIQNSNILNALIEHCEGVREMSATQVSAGLGLLKKIMPDLSSTELSGEVKHNYVARMPARVSGMDEWQNKYSPNQTPQIPTTKQ